MRGNAGQHDRANARGWGPIGEGIRQIDPVAQGQKAELQRSQAVDLRDWWTLSDPTTRAEFAGRKLPQRPKRARPDGRRIGARTEDADTAKKPLWTVSRFQRFAMTDDPEEDERIELTKMKEMRWEELFGDASRVMQTAVPIERSSQTCWPD